MPHKGAVFVARCDVLTDTQLVHAIDWQFELMGCNLLSITIEYPGLPLCSRIELGEQAREVVLDWSNSINTLIQAPDVELVD